DGDDGESEGIAGLPRRPGLSLILDDIAEIRKGRPPKNKLLIGVLGVVGLSVLIMLVAGIVSLVSGPSSSDSKTSSSDAKKSAASASAGKSAAPSGSTTTAAATTTSPIAIPPPPPPEPKTSGPMLGDCKSAGDAKTIAPRAVIASGIEAHALGSGLALGFAASARDAVATSLDPTSLSPTSTVRTKPAGGDARRVTPLLVGSRLTAMPDVDKKGDRLGTRRIVAASSLIDVGFADGAIVWAPHGKDSFAKLFAVEGEGPVEALRAVALADRKGIALTFRRGNAIHIGVAKGESILEADGALSKISGLGQVGSPAIAASGENIVVAWADRGGSGDDWKVRWTKLKPGSSTEEASSFTLPEGGLGGQAMSPSIAALGGGRFLLAWTEGPVSNHQVRAITMGADGSPSGSPIAISASGVNAGQPAAVVGSDGRGAVAFLAAHGKALEVHATPISCAAR
ncbi:MAG: Basic proline-rich protein, partial [Labilithrix sp.]|nr:Basic proline-rich protein [Labilithrix sp.]